MELLSLVVVALMVGSMLLWRIPAATCDQCEHCREARRTAEREWQDEWHRKVHAWSGGEQCPICRRDG